MGGIAQIVNSVVDLLGVHLEPWMAPAAFVAAFLLFWPAIRLNVRTGDARKLLVRAARERGAERVRMEAEALAMVRGQADGLVVVAKEALEQGRKELAEQAVAQLRATGKRLPQLRTLERALEPPLPAVPSEAALLVERMIETGMIDVARGRLAQARRRWPADDELEALEQRLATPAAAAPVSTGRSGI